MPMVGLAPLLSYHTYVILTFMDVTTPSFDSRASKRMKPKDAARWTKTCHDQARQPSFTTLSRYFGKNFSDGAAE